mgnify:CR=1 FL=1
MLQAMVCTASAYAAAIDNGSNNARRFYLYPDTTDTTKYWFGTATFDITVSTSVGGAVEASGSWAAATSVSYVG